MGRHIMKAKRGSRTQGMAADGAHEVRAYTTGAETWGMAADGARDRAKMLGVQRGGMWACMRGVNAGKTHVIAMCVLRGPGYTWCMHKGHRQGRQSVVHGPGAEAAALPVDRLYEGDTETRPFVNRDSLR